MDIKADFEKIRRLRCAKAAWSKMWTFVEYGATVRVNSSQEDGIEPLSETLISFEIKKEGL